MAPRRATKQLVVIVGPTASGKSDLAIKVAKAFEGEIINADSRTVYKGLDKGTAKPSVTAQANIPHYGFDLIKPSELFSAAQFQELANAWIKDIQGRGKLPILVGGTGLYIDGILFEYKFGGPAEPNLRQKLEALSLEELWAYCKENNIGLPKNYKNKRYIVRAIEQGGVNISRKKEIREHAIVVGIASSKERLRANILNRAERMFNIGVVEEATGIAKKYGWQVTGLSGNVYPIVRQLIEGSVTKQEAIEQAAVADWQLAKRQLTWFKRNPHIRWSQSTEQAYNIITEYLSKSA